MAARKAEVGGVTNNVHQVGAWSPAVDYRLGYLVQPAEGRGKGQECSLSEAAKRVGFKYVTLDLAGYRTGSHNEVLDPGRRSLRVVS